MSEKWGGIALCWWWVVLTFVTYFHFSGHLQTLGWNAVEFIISNHLRDFGLYATGAYYPPALWRPVLGTFTVYIVDGLISDPVLTFQIICGLALSLFVASIYITNWFLWGTIIANVGALLAFSFPAITTLLLTHIHSISHISMLAVLGPTVGLSLYCLQQLAEHKAPSKQGLFLCGLAWGLCYLARLELVFSAGIFFLTCLILLGCGRRLWIFVPLAGFLLLFLPYSLWRSTNAAEYNLLTVKPIYQFYNSQGWADPKPTDRSGDVEGDGYIYAIELYGTPEENSESIVKAIARNPQSFIRRVVKNSESLFGLFLSGEFVKWYVLALFLFSPLSLVFMSTPERISYLYLLSSFLNIVPFIFLHIDPRYITICVPFFILMASFSVAALGRLKIPALWPAVICLVVLTLLVEGLPGHARALLQTFARPPFDPTPMRELARRFLDIAKPKFDERRRMYVKLDLPSDFFGERPENSQLVYYYLRSALVLKGAEGIYPRGRIFSFRDCPPTHKILLAGREIKSSPEDAGNWRIVGGFTLGTRTFEVREYLDGEKPSMGCATGAAPKD